MIGVVEVYSDYGTPQQQLVEKSNNLIVDAAGEMIADLMTLPVAGSGISTASAIYDASNYVIHAVSFGKDARAYGYNMHGINSIIASGESGNRYHAIVSSTSISSYTPIEYLPAPPDPLDTKLEIIPVSTLNIGSGYYDSSPNTYPGTCSALSAISQFGQLVNLVMYGTLVFTNPNPNQGLSRAFLRTGAWPSNTQRQARLYTSNSTITASSTGFISNFNTVSSMDWRGFVKTTSSTNPLSGLVTSSQSNFSSTGEVIYKITVASADAAVANFYGGITQMGLWGLNLKSMLANGRTPPYTFHPYTNVLDYRLFSKKTFNKNIVGIQDNGSSAGLTNYSNLTIIWRIFFL